MSTHTSEQNKALVETLKGPRFYNISLTGYGGESAYMTVSKEAHDFWHPICEEHGDSDLSTYMNSDGEEEDNDDEDDNGGNGLCLVGVNSLQCIVVWRARFSINRVNFADCAHVTLKFGIFPGG